MKILITGATGFIGQNLLPQLCSVCPDVEVLTLNRSVEKAELLFPQDRFTNFVHTSADNWDMVRAFNPNIVIHLAALSTADNDIRIIDSLIASNITYGVQLLSVLSNCPSLKLFVNTGSFAEYRLGVQQFDSAYLYSATKTAFRTFLNYYAGLYAFKYITAVPYTVYGGNPTVKRLMYYIIESLDAPAAIEMTGGEQILDFIQVDDISRFLIYVIQNHCSFCMLEKNGEDFHLGTGRGTTVREVAKIIESVSKRRCNINWGARAYRDRDTMYAVAPIAKNIELIQWKAQIELKVGIERYLNKQ